MRNGVGAQGRTCDRPNCRVGAKPSEEKRRRANQLNAEPLVGSINDQLQIVVADGAVVAAGKPVEPVGLDCECVSISLF